MYIQYSCKTHCYITDARYLWLLGLMVAVLAVAVYLKCFKGKNHPGIYQILYCLYYPVSCTICSFEIYNFSSFLFRHSWHHGPRNGEVSMLCLKETLLPAQTGCFSSHFKCYRRSCLEMLLYRISATLIYLAWHIHNLCTEVILFPWGPTCFLFSHTSATISVPRSKGQRVKMELCY